MPWRSDGILFFDHHLGCNPEICENVASQAMVAWLEQIRDDFTKGTALFPFELILVMFLVLVVGSAGRPRPLFWPVLKQRFTRIANQRKLSVALVFVLSLFVHYLANRNEAIPAPGIHDEFSYLLAGETFSQGRLTNPPHPMRLFFESFHILTEPTYMSMYPPGQGLSLALGIALTGYPIAGVWIAAAGAAASMCWMLQAWTRPTWALIGGLIALLRISVFSYWANSYWGGAVSTIGGALLFGSVGRVLNRPHSWQGVVAGLGMLLLVGTRLWEGTIVSAVASTYTVVRKWHERTIAQRTFVLVLLSTTLTIASGAVWLCYYNYQITGNPFRLPYLENRSRNQVYGSFLWEKPNPDRTFDHEVIRKFYFETEGYREKLPYLEIQADKPLRLWYFIFGPALTPAIFGLFGAWRSRRLQLAFLSIAVFAGSHLLVPWHILPHYSGPIIPMVYLLIVEGFRRLNLWRAPYLWSGSILTKSSLAACVLMVVFRLLSPSVGTNVYREGTLSWYTYGLLANFNRVKIEDELKKMGGQHLVLVSYSPTHDINTEWVYNHADIDGSEVVWARTLPDIGKLQPLLDYYRNRKMWIIYPDRDPNRVYDYGEVRR